MSPGRPGETRAEGGRGLLVPPWDRRFLGKRLSPGTPEQKAVLGLGLGHFQGQAVTEPHSSGDSPGDPGRAPWERRPWDVEQKNREAGGPRRSPRAAADAACHRGQPSLCWLLALGLFPDDTHKARDPRLPEPPAPADEVTLPGENLELNRGLPTAGRLQPQRPA